MSADEQQVQSFFESWQLYQKIIAGNYMMHVEVIGCLKHVFQQCYKPTMSILELGCGDAYVLTKTLGGRSIAHYCGIDLSSQALQLAKENLAEKVVDISLHVANMQLAENYTDRQYDLIILGYSLHHLGSSDKQTILGWAADQLNEGGELFVYDEFREDTETREDYLYRCTQIFRQQWQAMTEAQLDRVVEHVLNQDFPESLSSWKKMVRVAGFNSCEWMLRDSQNLWGVVRLRR